MEKDIFISYSSKNEYQIKPVLDFLKDKGYTWFKAPEMIPAGSNYAREIPAAIKACKVFLLFLTSEAQESIWVEKEVDSAINNHKIVIPLRMDRVKLNDTYSFYLNNVQTISYALNPEMGLKLLDERLQLIFQSEAETQKQMEGFSVEKVKANENDQKKLKNRKKQKRRMFLGTSYEPHECEHCGGDVEKVSYGIYRCVDCGKDTFDAPKKVRDFLEKNGPQTSIVIARETGVKRTIIDELLRQEYLEIPVYAKERLACKKCGAPIRSGEMCDNCKGLRGAEQIERKSIRKERWRSER